MLAYSCSSYYKRSTNAPRPLSLELRAQAVDLGALRLVGAPQLALERLVGGAFGPLLGGEGGDTRLEGANLLVVGLAYARRFASNLQHSFSILREARQHIF